MPPVSVTCTNPECKASLKLPAAPPAGKKVRCPRCQTAFVPAPPAKAAPLGEADVIGLAPEGERSCPSCQAALAPNAVLCINCGFDLRTGEKRETVKKTKKKSGRSKDEPVTEDNLPLLLDEVDALLRLAQKELWGVPDFLGLGDDPRGVVGSPGRCANPNCHTTLDSGFIPNRRAGTSKVRVDLRDRIVTVELCESCTEMLLSFLANRDKTARSFVDEAREDLKRAQRQFPDNDGIAQGFKQVAKVEKMIAEKKAKSRLCFVATAAFGSPMAEEVHTLRRFRDEVLQGSALGRWFIGAYYRFSPPLADLIAGSSRRRALVRWLLRPVVAGCRRRLGRDVTP